MVCRLQFEKVRLLVLFNRKGSLSFQMKYDQIIIIIKNIMRGNLCMCSVIVLSRTTKLYYPEVPEDIFSLYIYFSFLADR